MFTGIVEAALPLAEVADGGGVRRITVDCAPLDDANDIKLGDSIAINGCCLTVAKLDGTHATFEAIPETLDVTSLGHLKTGDLVNIERAMQAGARFDGHIVQGHVDQLGKVADIIERGGEWRISVDCGAEFAKGCIHKGSVCIDGISLTIAELGDDAFTVAIIPHTREVTNIRNWKPGTPVNLEQDVIGKYVRRQLETTTRPQPE